ncbi:hypothetical protein QLX08_000962 [Tetragonisca angustula]|uniref:Uncharacterized protein n=1 Tax=Tetragonisca angustula TaxID=166442 RepID=A0AAW1AHY5_9HYME
MVDPQRMLATAIEKFRTISLQTTNCRRYCFVRGLAKQRKPFLKSQKRSGETERNAACRGFSGKRPGGGGVAHGGTSEATSEGVVLISCRGEKPKDSRALHAKPREAHSNRACHEGEETKNSTSRHRDNKA